MPRKKKIYDNDELIAKAESHNARERERAAQARRAGNEIGDIPPPVNPERKAKARTSLRYYLETYHPKVFSMQPWSEQHLRCIEKLERSAIKGGQFALALSRGAGKTACCTRAALFAALYGYRSFILIVGATAQAADEILENIRVELEFNELLAEDFPEVVVPLKKLQGQQRRAMGQTYHDKPTRIDISAGGFTFPTIDGALCSGVRIATSGVTARLRGLQHVNSDGVPVRPDYLILDDLQGDETANSEQGVEKMANLINGTLLGLAGPGVKIAAVAPCTVIRKNDLAERLLDDPLWAGERHKLLPSMPSEKAMELWTGPYKEAMIHSLKEKGDISEATEFYKQHLNEMRESAIVGWEARYNKEEEVDALQNAMNIYLKIGPQSFASEMQNEPLVNEAEDRGNLKEEHVFAKFTGRKPGEIPDFVEHLVLAIDVQQAFLPYAVVGFADNFTSHVIDFGSWPDQGGRIHYTVKNANHTLEKKYPGMTIESRTWQGLEDLCAMIVEKKWVRDDGTELAIDAIVVDSGWHKTYHTILSWKSESKYSHLIQPYKGAGISESRKAYSDYKRQPGLKVGLEWLLTPVTKRSRTKLLLCDTYFWKAKILQAVLTHRGDPGCLTFCGTPDSGKLITDAFTSEYFVPVIGMRKIDKFFVKPGRDNQHLFDCVDEAFVTASAILGCQFEEHNNTPKRSQIVVKEQVAAKERKPVPTHTSSIQEKKIGRGNYAPVYAPAPSRPSRTPLSGTIGIKR